MLLLLKLLLILINSVRINILIDIPIIPDQVPNNKYINLIFLWLVEYIHLIIKNNYILNLKFKLIFLNLIVQIMSLFNFKIFYIK